MLETRYLIVGGIRMRWEEQGEGSPVVFLHGVPTCPSLWRHVIPRVREARCLAWEMVGYGASIPEGRGRDISVDQQAEYLVAWMQAVGLERAVLVGHDLGGGVAQIAAVRHPERVTGLVLANSISYDSWPIPAVKVMRALGPVIEQLPNVIIRLFFHVLMLRGHNNRKQIQESLAVHWPHYATRDAGVALVRQARSLDVRDTLRIADRLPELKLPVQLVWGAADPFLKIGYGYRLAYDLDAELDRIEGGLHFVPEDHPDRVSAAVQRLLDEINFRSA